MANPTGAITAVSTREIAVQGGNLFRVALRELGDALQWTRIADLNADALRAAGALGGCDPVLPANVVLTLKIPPRDDGMIYSGVLGL